MHSLPHSLPSSEKVVGCRNPVWLAAFFCGLQWLRLVQGRLLVICSQYVGSYYVWDSASWWTITHVIFLQVNGTIQVELKKPMEDITAKPYFRTSPFTLFNESQALEATKHIFEQLLRRILDYQREGSGWVFNEIIGFQVSIHKHAPLKASSYMEIPTEH